MNTYVLEGALSLGVGTIVFGNDDLSDCEVCRQKDIRMKLVFGKTIKDITPVREWPHTAQLNLARGMM